MAWINTSNDMAKFEDLVKFPQSRQADPTLNLDGVSYTLLQVSSIQILIIVTASSHRAEAGGRLGSARKALCAAS